MIDVVGLPKECHRPSDPEQQTGESIEPEHKSKHPDEQPASLEE